MRTRVRFPPPPPFLTGQDMQDRLLEIARKIQQHPWNQPGTDKSWVLQAMWERQRFDREVREAQVVEPQ